MDHDYIRKVRRKSPSKQQKPKPTVKILTPKEHNEDYYLGEILFGKTNNALPETWDECKADITSKYDEDKLILYFDSTMVLVILTTDANFLKNLLYSRKFSMKFFIHEDNVIVSLYLTDLPLEKFYPRLGSVMKTVFSLIFDISYNYNDIPEQRSSLIESYPNLYKNVSLYREKPPDTDINVQHAQLKPTLRKYQEEAVRWMIHREQKPAETEILHPMYEKVKLCSNVEIYYDKHTGFIDCEMPMTQSLITGGILADEMGLGKTVEVLACILSHPCATKQSTSENDMSSSPTIDRQSKKRKIKEARDEPDPDYRNETKKIKVPDIWVKPSSKKGALRVALESWYNSVLSNDKPKKDLPKIQCICGETMDMEDNVACCTCSKIQHGKCLGYESSYGPYYCPQCWMEMPLLETHGTLIVTPGSLNEQWCQEIRKHVTGNFKVLLYKSGFLLAPIYPSKLKEYDVVITTYSVLQNELRLSENGQVVTLRRPPKYSLPGSPISRLKWWRLCLDEAQTVETPGHMVSEMARRLTAHHRWAVTGTPISKDISDLYGLIDYLQISPYSDVDTWRYLLYTPYINRTLEPMHKFLAKILWRTSKKDVLDQINIPEQTTKEYWLEFSDVEKFFYQREHEMCSKEFLHHLQYNYFNTSSPLSSMNKNYLMKIMQPLLAIRQACCHHQAVRGKYLATRKQVSSMEDLLNALIAKNINESEEYLRVVISALNGLGGVYLILQNPSEAVEQYREVLKLYSRFSGDISLHIDKLQLIHTMYNLSDVLEKYPNIPPILKESSLKEQWLGLEKEYMMRYAKQSAQVLQDNLRYSAVIDHLQGKFIFAPAQWFSDALDWVSTTHLFDDYVTRLTSTMHSANITQIRDTSERQILYAVAVWDEDLSRLKEETLDAIYDLFISSEDDTKVEIPTEIIEAATDCHLRPQKYKKKSKNKKKCPVCLANVVLKKYESKLFSSTTKDDDIANAGTWKPAAEEFMLRALHSLGRQRNIDQELLHDAEIHLQILDILKKEFKEIRKLWTYIETQICAKDEIDMCKIRLSIKQETPHQNEISARNDRLMRQLDYVEDNKFETIHMLSEHEVSYHRSGLHNECKIKSTALEKNIGTYKYLQTLHTQQTSGQTPDPCPICKCALEKQWNILPCGHCFCIECIQTILGQKLGQHIQCSVCRSNPPIADITFITDTKQDESSDSKIKGDCSTKVEAVVRLVLALRQDDPDVKVLMFSNWQTILKVLNTILDINYIRNEILTSQNFDRVLEKFKNKSKGVTVLLLPISLGSKGLNLIEATHVIFVEPLLDPGDELQAIGRIHRIGQTKPTVVHKFYIKDTIEENIYHATTSTTIDWNRDKITLHDIKNLFEKSERRMINLIEIPDP